VRFAAPPG